MWPWKWVWIWKQWMYAILHGHGLTLWQIRMDDIFVAVIFCLRTLVCGGKVKIKFIWVDLQTLWEKGRQCYWQAGCGFHTVESWKGRKVVRGVEWVFGANDNEASRKKSNKKGGARARMASQGQESAVGGKMGEVRKARPGKPIKCKVIRPTELIHVIAMMCLFS